MVVLRRRFGGRGGRSRDFKPFCEGGGIGHPQGIRPGGDRRCGRCRLMPLPEEGRGATIDPCETAEIAALRSRRRTCRRLAGRPVRCDRVRLSRLGELSGASWRSRYPPTPTARAICRRMAISWSEVMREGVAERRALDVVATRCDTAQHGLLQPFSAVGAIATERSGALRPRSAAPGWRSGRTVQTAHHPRPPQQADVCSAPWAKRPRASRPARSGRRAGRATAPQPTSARGVVPHS
jgi:hypothetical protein